MLSKATVKLVEEIFEYFGEEDKEKAQKEPEACLISMLTLIKKELPHAYVTLKMGIELAADDDYLEEAREKLKETPQEVS